MVTECTKQAERNLALEEHCIGRKQTPAAGSSACDRGATLRRVRARPRCDNGTRGTSRCLSFFVHCLCSSIPFPGAFSSQRRVSPNLLWFPDGSLHQRK